MTITALPTPPSRTDAPATFITKADAFIAALPQFVTETNAQAAAFLDSGISDTSASSNSIGTGAKTFTVSSAKGYQPGMYLIIADAVAPSTNSMYGQVTSYSGTTLMVNILSVTGSGTKTTWAISQSTVGGATSSSNTFTGLQTFAVGANIASAATVDLTAATGNTLTITGTTTVTAFTMTAGQQMELIAAGALPLTYHATTMNINGGVSYTCAAGDRLFVNKAADNVVRVNVVKQDGTAVVGGSLSFRNRIRNGDFRVNQTGFTYISTSLRPNNDDSYTLDGWYILSDGNDTIDVSQDTATIPTNGYAAIALDVETTNRKFGIAQIIEARDCVDLIGNTVTLSFKAKVSTLTNLDNVKCAIVAWSGTEDAVTSDIVSSWNVEGTNPTLIANATYENTPANLNLTTSYADYSVTADIDTASTKNIIVFIWSDVTTTSAGEFLYITDVQLEQGSTATPFERKPFDFELAWAERFLSVFSAAEGLDNVLGAGVVATTTIVRIVWSYKRPLRKAPTALLSSGVANFEVANGAVRTPTVIAFSTAGVDAAQVAFTVGSALTANTGAYAYAVNTSATLILTGAEL